MKEREAKQSGHRLGKRRSAARLGQWGGLGSRELSRLVPTDADVLRRRGIVHFGIWLLVAFGLLLQFSVQQTSREFAALGALVLTVFGVISVSRCSRSGFWSPSAIFLLLTGLFHVGLAVNVLTGIDPEFPRGRDYFWFQGPSGTMAFQLVTVGVVAFVLMATLAAATTPRTASFVAEWSEPQAGRFATVGSAVLLASVAGWFLFTIAAVGISGLFGSYQAFLSGTSGSNVPYTYQFMGIGLGLVALARPRLLGQMAIVAFALFGLIGFFLGLRGEILFPIAVAMTVLAARRTMPRVSIALLGMLGLLFLINAAREIRQLGVRDTDLTASDVSPLAALVELGSTLRVAATTVDWHVAGQEPYALGATYTVSGVRALESLTQGSARIPAASDFRLFNSEIAARAGNIGGSVIGEAFHNFSWLGPIIVMGALGVMFMLFSRPNPTVTRLAVYVACAVPLFNHIRNSFVPVPAAIVTGLLLVLVVSITGTPASKRRDAVAER